MNLFNFDLSLALQGLLLAYFWGLFLGFIIGLLRYLVFYVVYKREHI